MVSAAYYTWLPPSADTVEHFYGLLPIRRPRCATSNSGVCGTCRRIHLSTGGLTRHNALHGNHGSPLERVNQAQCDRRWIATRLPRTLVTHQDAAALSLSPPFSLLVSLSQVLNLFDLTACLMRASSGSFQKTKYRFRY